jgi:hypothetical protein
MDADKSQSVEWKELQTTLNNLMGSRVPDRMAKMMLRAFQSESGNMDSADGGSLSYADFQKLFNQVQNWGATWTKMDTRQTNKVPFAVVKDEVSKFLSPAGIQPQALEFLLNSIKPEENDFSKQVTKIQYYTMMSELQCFQTLWGHVPKSEDDASKTAPLDLNSFLLSLYFCR